MATVARFWRVRNLRDSPLFQAALEQSEDARDPLHLFVYPNNLENPTKANAQNTAQVLRDLRDHCLLVPGLHFIFAGTDGAVRQVIYGQPHLLCVFDVPELISPVEAQEVQDLLRRRYEYLKINKNEPVPSCWRPLTGPSVDSKGCQKA